MSLTVLNDVFEFDFARIALVCTFVVSAISGILSPIIVLKERSYIGDTLTHLVFPGVIGGYLIAQMFGLATLPVLFFGAGITALLGGGLSEFFVKKLRLPADAGAVVVLTGFFGVGLLAMAGGRGSRFDFERILFGDILTLTWIDAAVLAVVFFLVLAAIVGFRRDWDAWVSDPEFAVIAGYRVKTLERLFPVLVTLTVLSGMFAVGGLMMSALLALPAVLQRPRSVFSVRAILVSLVLGFVGLAVAFQFDRPVGASIVVAGLLAVSAKAVFVTIRR